MIAALTANPGSVGPARFQECSMCNRFRVSLPAALVAVTLMALLSACGGSAPNPVVTIPLTGTVTDAYSGKPVPAARIKLGAADVTTDSNGKYQLTTWDTSQTLQIGAKGYAAVSIALSSRPELARPTPPAAILDTQLRPDILSGVITDAATNKPIAGATVQSDSATAQSDP